jgi:replication factor C small subunit
MAKLALSGKFEEARNKLYQLLMERGLAGEDILDQLHREIFNLEVPETVKVNLLEKLGETDFRLTEGGNERIQLEALLAHFVLVGSRLK